MLYPAELWAGNKIIIVWFREDVKNIFTVCNNTQFRKKLR